MQRRAQDPWLACMEQAEAAERLVEEEWPSAAETAAARQEAAEATTPLPERIWALTNVGSTLALGGPGERARSRQLLERAIQLKRRLTGSARHPGAVFQDHPSP